ncbi:hypothetical protein pb186bvf_008930 [Paramecium bursaria]
MNQFKDYINNKQVNQLQEELRQAQSLINKLQSKIDRPDDVDEILKLKDQLIKANKERLQYKQLLEAHSQHSDVNILQFFEYFKIPQEIKNKAKFQMIIEKFIDQKKEIEYLTNIKKQFDHIHNQNHNHEESFLKRINEYELKNQELNKQIQEFNKQIEYLNSKIIEYQQYCQSLQQQIIELEQRPTIDKQIQWDLIVECKQLKQLLNDGWDFKLQKEIQNYSTTSFYFSEHLDLINQQLQSYQIDDYIINNYVYFKQIQQQLLGFKQITCTHQPISYIKKQEEALDEFWIMFALLQNADIIILANINILKSITGSQSYIFYNQYENRVNNNLIEHTITQSIQEYCIALLPWFFQDYSNEEIVKDKFQIQCKGGKVKIDRATILPHTQQDYYQIGEQLSVFLIKPVNYQYSTVKYKLLQNGILIKIKIQCDHIIKRVCQILSYYSENDYQIRTDDNNIIISI